MAARNGISRRQILRMAASTAGLAMAGVARGVCAQSSPRIEQWDDELEKILSLALAQSDPCDGTWVLNVAKSGGEPRTQILTIQIEGDREAYRSDLVWPDGRRQVTTYTAPYDGKEYPSQTVMTSSSGETSPPRHDTVVLRRVDERTRERHWNQDGRLVRILRRSVSPDGRTLTSQVIDVDEAGVEKLASTLIFDRR
jgi:hypothetical protein